MSRTSVICASHSPLLYCYAKEPADWEAIQAAYAERRQQVEAFDPELVIAFGADHYNGFFMNLMPAFCVGSKAHAVGDIGGFEGELDVPSELATEAVGFLRSEDIDPAISANMTVDHGFSQTITVMTGSLDARPVIPVFINCMAEPFVPFRRSRLMGAACGRFAAKTGKRVLFLASGGMSHHPRRYYPVLGEGPDEVTQWQLSGGRNEHSLSPPQWLDRLLSMHHEGAQMIVRGERTPKDMFLNEESDRKFLEVLTAGELEKFDSWQPGDLVREGGIGSMELQTWIAASAANLAAGGNAVSLDYYSIAPEIGISLGIAHA